MIKISDEKPVPKKNKYGRWLPIIVYGDDPVEQTEVFRFAYWDSQEWSVDNRNINWTFFTHWVYLNGPNGERKK